MMTDAEIFMMMATGVSIMSPLEMFKMTSMEMLKMATTVGCPLR